MREADIQADIVEYLEAIGWFVTVTSQDRATRGQLAGLPDLIAVKHNHTLFVECKTQDGRLRESQHKWLQALGPHMGTHVLYTIARSLEDVMSVIERMINHAR